jgi:hypothetical protein
VPVAALFADEVVLAEVRVSEATIEHVRHEGREACKEAAERLALRLERLIWQEAIRAWLRRRVGLVGWFG